MSTGLAESPDHAGEIQDKAMLRFAGPLGLVTDAYVVDEEKRHAKLMLSIPRNMCLFLFALCLYAVLAFWLVAYGAIVVSENPETDIEVEAWRYSEGSELLPKIWIKSRTENVTIEARECSIRKGNYVSYAKYRDLGQLHSEHGGCDLAKEPQDLSAFQEVDARTDAHGCKHFESSVNAHCWLLQPARLLGQFGDEEYRFLAVKLSTPLTGRSKELYALAANENMSAALELSHALAQERLSMSILWEELGIKQLENLDGHVYSSRYFTFPGGDVTTLEMYFKRVQLRRFTNKDLGASAFMSNAMETWTGDRGGQSSSWTQYSEHYTRKSKFELFSEDKVLSMEIFFRATALEESRTERPKVTFLELPQIMGGFFTGFVLFAGQLFLGLGAALLFLRKLVLAVWACGSRQVARGGTQATSVSQVMVVPSPHAVAGEGMPIADMVAPEAAGSPGAQDSSAALTSGNDDRSVSLAERVKQLEALVAWGAWDSSHRAPASTNNPGEHEARQPQAWPAPAEGAPAQEHGAEEEGMLQEASV